MSVVRTELPSGIHQIRLPMAGNPLGHINGYLIPHGDRYVLVDCGWDSDDVFETLVAALGEIGATLTDIETIVVTHYHHDHYGMAGRIVRESGARLLMHALDWERVHTHLAGFADHNRESDRWLVRNGLDADSSAASDEHAHEIGRRFTVAQPSAMIVDGEHLEVNGSPLEVVWTPGHSPGHACLFSRKHRLVLTGDHILTPITPHVGAWRSGSHDALADYIASLHKMDALDADTVLPAHGEPFAGLHRRIAELLAHHEERTSLIIEALAQGPADAAEIASRLPWTRRARRLSELSPYHREFAVAETLAHLINLQAQHKAQVVESNPTIRYAVVD